MEDADTHKRRAHTRDEGIYNRWTHTKGEHTQKADIHTRGGHTHTREGYTHARRGYTYTSRNIPRTSRLTWRHTGKRRKNTSENKDIPHHVTPRFQADFKD
jgi:hypothetical protein